MPNYTTKSNNQLFTVFLFNLYWEKMILVIQCSSHPSTWKHQITVFTQWKQTQKHNITFVPDSYAITMTRYGHVCKSVIMHGWWQNTSQLYSFLYSWMMFQAKAHSANNKYMGHQFSKQNQKHKIMNPTSLDNKWKQQSTNKHNWKHWTKKRKEGATTHPHNSTQHNNSFPTPYPPPHVNNCQHFPHLPPFANI